MNNQSLQENVDYITDDHAGDFGYKHPSSNDGEHGYSDKPMDSEVDASENVKVTSDSEESHHHGHMHADSDANKYESGVRIEENNYYIRNDSDNSNKHVYDNSQEEEGDIIIGSEKKQDQYLTHAHNSYDTDIDNRPDRKPGYSHEIIDLKPPAIIPVFEPNGHSRPFSKPNFAVSNSDGNAEVITESSDINHVAQVNVRPVLGQVFQIQTDPKERESQQQHRNKTYAYRGRPQYSHATRTHPDHPQIITKPKPQVPGPVLISSGKVQKPSSHHRKSTVQFSLPIDSTGEENESKTQTERAPSASTGPKKPTEESLATAFQTNFASTDSKEDSTNNEEDVSKIGNLSQDMVPPPVGNNQGQMDEGLRPPPSPTDVLGLSPPPVDITSIRPTTTSMATTMASTTTTPVMTTTSSHRPLDNKSKIKSDVTGLKPPPLYIPLKESSIAPPLPSVNMVPPSPRPSVVRPYLADILSQVSARRPS